MREEANIKRGGQGVASYLKRRCNLIPGQGSKIEELGLLFLLFLVFVERAATESRAGATSSTNSFWGQHHDQRDQVGLQGELQLLYQRLGASTGGTVRAVSAVHSRGFLRHLIT